MRMPIPDAEATTGFEKNIVIAITSVGAVVCLLSVVAFFLSKYFKSAAECCSSCLGKKDAKTNPSAQMLATRWQTMGFDTADRKSSSSSPCLDKRKARYSRVQFDSYKNASFRIPGQVRVQTQQPEEDATSTSGYSTMGSTISESGSSGVGVVGTNDGMFEEEYIQPRDRSPSRDLRYNSKKSLASYTNEGEMDVDTLNLGLYNDFKRKTTQHVNLGKVKFQLQYEDKTRRNLILNLQEIDNMRFIKPDIVGVYASLILLPEREYKYASKQLYRNTKLEFNQKFVFASRPHNRDFESRTVLISLMCVDKSAKEYQYGEARMSLMSREIYSQIETDVSLGIKPCLPASEIGDAQVMLSYSAEQQKLTVMIKCIKFPTSSVLESMNGVHIKAYLARLGGERLGKKKSISRSIAADSTTVDFADQMSFKLQTENFMLCTLKLNIHGRHKIMRKHLSIGKIRIGDSSRDQGGKVHWKTVISSADISWNMWHPIFNN